MADTNFVDQVTVIQAPWLNDVNDHVYNVNADVHPASGITNTPAGTIAAITVQAAINELDTEKESTANKSTTLVADLASNTKFPSVKAVYDWVTGFFVAKTSSTGSAQIPNGTTAQRDSSPVDGYTRVNMTLAQLEVYIGAAWQGIVGLTSNLINFINVAGTFTSSLRNVNTAARTYTFQDRDGMIADLTDLGGTQLPFAPTCTQAAGALTFGIPVSPISFRSATLTSGAINKYTTGALSLVLPSGGTLGAVTTVQARLILVAIDNAGTPELAVINLAGGNSLDETGIINTTAISAASTANNLFYSTTARTGVAYRVISAIDAVNTAGAWASPVLVQGAGGNALSAMSSLGYGQTWQDVSGSRIAGTTYYNTTGRTIQVSIWIKIVTSSVTSATLLVNGVTVGSWFSSGGAAAIVGVGTFAVVPPGATYVLSNNMDGRLSWAELR